MKPILFFNTEMVRAILDGRKTVTRRPIKPKYRKDEGGFQVRCLRTDVSARWVEKIDEDGGGFDPPRYVNPPYHPGEILYVRETWAELETVYGHPYFAYKADEEKLHHSAGENFTRWHPSIHMPREAARIFLRVTDVRVERLQEIDEEQAKAEGANFRVGIEDKFRRSAIDRFVEIWNSTIKPKDRDKYGWASNPWVWVISFERFEKPEATP